MNVPFIARFFQNEKVSAPAPRETRPVEADALAPQDQVTIGQSPFQGQPTTMHWASMGDAAQYHPQDTFLVDGGLLEGDLRVRQGTGANSGDVVEVPQLDGYQPIYSNEGVGDNKQWGETIAQGPSQHSGPSRENGPIVSFSTPPPTV